MSGKKRYYSATVVFQRTKTMFLFFVLFTCFHPLQAQVVKVTNDTSSFILSEYMQELVDSSGNLSAAQVMQQDKFSKTNGAIPLFPNQVKSVWFRFTVAHQATNSAQLFLNIAYPNLSDVSLYAIDSGQAKLIGEEGNEVISSQHITGSPNIVFNLRLPQGHSQQYLLHVYSRHPIILPATVLTYDALHESITFQTIVTGLYLGVLMIMFVYNLFLFFATKDNNYLFYVLYILFLSLAQTTLAGYEYRYLWPTHPAFNKYAVIFTSSLSAMSGLVFSMLFLRTSENAKRTHKWLQLLVAIYALGLCLSFFTEDLSINYNILNYNGLVGVLSVLVTSFYIAKKNFRPAYFYLTAWLFFLVTFIILILRNLAILPYNNFTTYIIYVGSSLEVALLSIALADKINVLRMEKEASQADALRTLLEKEKIVRDQNVELERKVTERTEELSSSNTHLSNALDNLKDTQIQLVEAEKMASLGQLTAGIAHEINNPINFVKSNIGPLQLDIHDLLSVIDEYDKLHGSENSEIPEKLVAIDKFKKKIDVGYLKTEIESLVKGIREGAERTAEIVQGLRTFSRLDESEIKTVNIYEGLDSSLVLLKNLMPANIVIEKNLQGNGVIECYPGKLNQVFMNIVGNAIQAIKQKPVQSEKEYLSISSRDMGDQLELRIKDTGIGMSEDVKRKIYDPFFTQGTRRAPFRSWRNRD